MFFWFFVKSLAVFPASSKAAKEFSPILAPFSTVRLTPNRKKSVPPEAISPLSNKCVSIHP
ncbi:MAG: hypothetical protein HRT68_01435 [Flavobacteriaceae bacterium]|nr:hypothetical protein [Flavobacteriaceae bacterium]